MKNTIFSDVNLDKISFSPTGRNICLDFIDMRYGEFTGKISCDAVSFFHYQTCLPNDEGLPCYVGEASSCDINQTGMDEFLRENGYAFYKSVDAPISPDDLAFVLVRIIGGEVVLTLICEKINVIEKELGSRSKEGDIQKLDPS